MQTNILTSRRFWTAISDAVISLVLYFISTFYPAQVETIKFVIGALQPVVAILILAFTADDVASISAEAKKHVANQSLAEAHVSAMADKVSTATVIPVIGDPVVTPQP